MSKAPKGRETAKPKTDDSQSTDELQAKLDIVTNALKVERADNENMRRRYDDQLAAVRSQTKVALVRELLPIFDNVERAIQHAPSDNDADAHLQGVQSIFKQFGKILESWGVERIDAVGETFDPKYHDAVQMDESGQGSHEIVSKELLPGYMLGNDVVRHSMVEVKMGHPQPKS